MNEPLFVFEMANNHQGNVSHGKRIIQEIRKACDEFDEFEFAFKFQYRDLDTFIHPDYKDRFDMKNIKRFQETRLSQDDFQEMLSEVRRNGFLAICTPFDEMSVDHIVAQGYDYIKIASCSFTDWPLLEKIATAGIPVIASGAGSSIEDVRRVVNFFQNRNIDISLMHCVAEYPTPNDRLQLNQIDYYKSEFPGIRIGFSTHEKPDNMIPIELAVAKGATIFEKHVGVPTDVIQLNGYSANPNQVRSWLKAARKAYQICGTTGKRYQSTPKEQADLLALRRGVFAKKEIKSGEELKKGDYFLAFPSQEGQLTANDLSKYNRIRLVDNIKINEPLLTKTAEVSNSSKDVLDAVKHLVQLIKESGVVIPAGSICELSHHYGMDRFGDTGVAMLECVNREYCKKILVVLPGQSHPSHYHIRKEETFIVLHGDLTIVIDNEKRNLQKGDVITIERKQKHSFSSKNGCVFEEISSTHYLNDSYYEDSSDFVSPRKTLVHFTHDMLTDLMGFSHEN